MRRWLWIPLTLAVAFVGDRLGGAALANLTERSQFRYSRLYTDRGAAQIVMLGNSRGLNFYQPYIEQKTGRSTLNLSYNALPGDLGAVLLRDYLSRYGAPEDLIVDITFLDRDYAALAQDFRLYAPYSSGIDSLVEVAGKSIHVGTHLAHLTRYGGEVAQRMLYYLNRSDEDWLLDREISPQMIADTVDLAPYRLAYETSRLDGFARTLALYRKAGSRVHLVINPYYPAFGRTIGNLDSLGAQLTASTGIAVRDYSAAIEGERFFGDYQHLNRIGAERYLARLIADLSLASE